jgi:hypothetical protein
MKILTAIPFALDAEQLMADAHVDAGSGDAADFLSMVELAREVGRPKAAYAPSFITERDGDRVQIEEVWFQSRTLARNLESVERVFALVATCGHELDDAFPARGDMLKEFWWDLIKAHLLGAANQFLSEHVHRTFRLGKTAIMRPGSGDASVWPIEQQKDLFRLLDGVEEKLGVRLTESSLMIPNKTLSGILFPTETDFRSCEVCHRENCPSRHAPFNKELWEEIQHD